MKDKIKASDLFVELMLTSQIAMASEDSQIIKRISENHPDISDSEKMLIKDIGISNEYMRISMIKTIIITLVKLGIVEEDVDILNLNNSNQLVAKAMDIFEKTK
jgi:hypothetical protein